MLTVSDVVAEFPAMRNAAAVYRVAKSGAGGAVVYGFFGG